MDEDIHQNRNGRDPGTGRWRKGVSGNPLGRGFRKAVKASEAGLSRRQVSDLRMLNNAETLAYLRGEVPKKQMTPWQRRLEKWEASDPRSFYASMERVGLSRPAMEAPIIEGEIGEGNRVKIIFTQHLDDTEIDLIVQHLNKMLTTNRLPVRVGHDDIRQCLLGKTVDLTENIETFRRRKRDLPDRKTSIFMEAT